MRRTPPKDFRHTAIKSRLMTVTRRSPAPQPNLANLEQKLFIFKQRKLIQRDLL